MRILITLDFPPEVGGIQRYLFNIAKYTYNKYDEVLVGCSKKEGSECKNLQCRVQYFSNFLSGFNKKFSILSLLPVIFKRIKTRSPETYFEAGNVYAAIPLYFLSLFIPLKYSVYCYGKELFPLRKKGWRRYLISKILFKADKIFHITHYTSTLLSNFNLHEKLYLVSPRIDSSLLNDKPDYTLHDPIHLISVGRLVEHKDHASLIKAVSQLPSFLNWRLTIAGTGPLYGFLKSLAASYNMKDKIMFTGEINDQQLWLLYKSADIFLFPSLETDCGTEGFGIVLLEAMAQGLGIIASQTGAIPEVLKNGRLGLLTKPGSVEAWADNIKKIISSYDLRKRLIDNAKTEVQENYIWK